MNFRIAVRLEVTCKDKEEHQPCKQVLARDQQLHLHIMRQTENRAAVSVFTLRCTVLKQP